MPLPDARAHRPATALPCVMAITVIAPADLVVAESDGITIQLGGVQLDAQGWDGQAGMRVHLHGLRGPETMRRDEDFHAAREAWCRDFQQHGQDLAVDPPQMPGVAVLDRVQVVVSDDVGTDYRLLAGQVAGDGTDWEASWVHGPFPPAHASRLHLTFTLDGEPTGSDCTVLLD